MNRAELKQVANGLKKSRPDEDDEKAWEQFESSVSCVANELQLEGKARSNFEATAYGRATPDHQG